MAVREEEHRRVGGGAEKLLTLEEAARRLGRPADDLEAMIRQGRLPAFRLGGNLLRLRWADVEALRGAQPEPKGPSPRPPAAASFWDRLADFLHFNDFYLVITLIILTLLALILVL